MSNTVGAAPQAPSLPEHQSVQTTAADTTQASQPAQTISAEAGLPETAMSQQPTPELTQPQIPLASTPALQPAPKQEALVEADPFVSQEIEELCREIGKKLGSVSVQDCLGSKLQHANGYSINERTLVKREFLPADGGAPKARVLILGGIHGDEYSSISIMFKWMTILSGQLNNEFHWRFLPSTNPDGLLDGRAIRMNANGVDLNRNFPSQDWGRLAHSEWARTTNKNPRRFPGKSAASEPEVQWLVKQIEEFQPHVIVSVHAPYDLLDFDGPTEAPQKIGELYLHQLGVYPGSLGNYSGIDLGIPVVTLELPSAGIMPSQSSIQHMWNDLNQWLGKQSYSKHDIKQELSQLNAE